VRIVGRKEVPGRPIMYGTTKFFLEHFGLQDIAQLPPLREFKELGEAEQALLPIEDPMMISEGTTGDAEPQTLIDSPVLSADEGDTLLVS
jgi:segregation and condensation protein B